VSRGNVILKGYESILGSLCQKNTPCMAGLGSAPLEPIQELTFLPSHTLETKHTKAQFNFNFTEPFPIIHMVTIRKCLNKFCVMKLGLQCR
jgi:hypothetical protein